MSGVFSLLGITTGVVTSHRHGRKARAAFEADITYVTANHLGWIYLIDNTSVQEPEELVIHPLQPSPIFTEMARHCWVAMAVCGRITTRVLLSQCITRPFHYAIVDEADSVLIDDVVNPLIISGNPEQNAAEQECWQLADQVTNLSLHLWKAFVKQSSQAALFVALTIVFMPR